MTRIIGGTAGGRRLRTPSGPLTRPTSDRVREALFSALESALGSLAGLRFLDLYAGSGAVGLEAASRGATAVTLVEQDRRTAALVRQNAAAADLVGQAAIEVVPMSVSRYLGGDRVRPPGSAYDVVFLDPPYDLAAAKVTDDLRALTRGWLTDDALVVVERSTRTGAVAWPSGYEPARTRTYGETALWSGTWSSRSDEVLRYGHDDLPASPPVQEP
ncbi:MAG: rRNA (guanine966-N2)-methyltransferase [Nocardioidaceae bacterium]|nr:rRNA (guanine966-N2)-methyltransferase [Nocardioidaceae bacterium]